MRSNRRTPVLHKGGPREGGTRGFLSNGTCNVEHIFYNQLDTYSIRSEYFGQRHVPDRISSIAARPVETGAPRWEPNDRKRVRPDALEMSGELETGMLRIPVLIQNL